MKCVNQIFCAFIEGSKGIAHGQGNVIIDPIKSRADFLTQIRHLSNTHSL